MNRAPQLTASQSHKEPSMHRQQPTRKLRAEFDHEDKSALASPAIARSRILVVEDDPAFCAFVAWSLENHGYWVMVAQGIAEARAACNDVESGAPFDLVVSDIRVPRGSGTDLLFAAEIVSRGTPVILMTAFAPPELRAFVEGCGADLFDKPFPIDALLDRVLLRLRDRFSASPENTSASTGGLS
jgi:DNA-binding response OmpR family regulator